MGRGVGILGQGVTDYLVAGLAMAAGLEFLTLGIAATALALSLYQERRHAREKWPFVEVSLFRRDEDTVGIRITGRNPSRSGVVVGPVKLRCPRDATFDFRTDHSESPRPSRKMSALCTLAPGEDKDSFLWISLPGGATYGGTLRLTVWLQSRSSRRRRHWRVTRMIKVIPFRSAA